MDRRRGQIFSILFSCSFSVEIFLYYFISKYLYITFTIMYRTHTCGALNAQNIGQEVTLA